MSTYVMSDLHGNYDSYIKMLELIQLSDDDTLYILGDILDRGPNPIKLLLDLMKRTNVRILAGNHCAMALECLSFLMQEITEDSIKMAGPNILLSLSDWRYNGGDTTVKELRKYDKKMQREIVEFISGLEMYAELSVGGKEYILVHSGLGNFAPDRPLWDYELDELVWERPDYTKAYFEIFMSSAGIHRRSLLKPIRGRGIFIRQIIILQLIADVMRKTEDLGVCVLMI